MHAQCICENKAQTPPQTSAMSAANIKPYTRVYPSGEIIRNLTYILEVQTMRICSTEISLDIFIFH
jgi:hypothetical protein